MKPMLMFIMASLSFAESTVAQIPQAAMPLYYVPAPASRVEGMRDVPRAAAPSLQTSIDLAVAAVEACDAKGYKASVLVTDSIGVPVVMLSGDGAGERSQLITYTKAHTVVKYRKPSGEISQMAKDNPELAEEIARNPNIGAARKGAFPLWRDGELIGVLSVSGGSNVACAEEAMNKVPLN